MAGKRVAGTEAPLETDMAGMIPGEAFADRRADPGKVREWPQQLPARYVRVVEEAGTARKFRNAAEWTGQV